MLHQRCKIKLQPRASVLIPRVATDATLDIGAISHITGRRSHVRFKKLRYIVLLIEVLCSLCKVAATILICAGIEMLGILDSAPSNNLSNTSL